MKLKESHIFTQTYLVSVVEVRQRSFKLRENNFRKEVESNLRENGQEMMDIDGLSDVFDETSPYVTRLPTSIPKVNKERIIEPIFR